MGRRVACPKCKNPFAVPPPPPPTPKEIDEVVLVDEPKIGKSTRKMFLPKALQGLVPSGEKWKKPSTVIAFAMLALTVLLPVGMVVVTILSLATADRGVDQGNGMYMHQGCKWLPRNWLEL